MGRALSAARGIIRQPAFLSIGLLAMLAWAPLPFGSVTPWGTAIVELAGFVVLALALLLAPPDPPLPLAARRVALALVVLAAIGVAQSLAWPAALVRLVSSEHLRLDRESANLLDRPSPSMVSLSLAPTSSRRTAVVCLLGAAALLSGALLGRSRRGRRAILWVLLASALFQVGFGFRMRGRRELWGLELPWRRGGLHGTFVNPNHLATYLLIAVAALFAFVWWLHRRSLQSKARHGSRRLGLAVALWLPLLAGVALTGSRAGLLAVLAGLAAQVTLVSLGDARRRVYLAGVAALVAAAALMGFLGLRSGLARLSDPARGGGFRLGGMADTARLFARFPLTGVGLGAFRAAFPLTHRIVGEEGTWWHAHNDWLELAATTGVAGLSVAALGVAALARGLRQSWRLGERSEDRAAALAAIGACVAVGLQELLDFGLTIPANSVTLAVVCGAALAVPLAQPGLAQPALAQPAAVEPASVHSEDGEETARSPAGEAAGPGELEVLR